MNCDKHDLESHKNHYVLLVAKIFTCALAGNVGYKLMTEQKEMQLGIRFVSETWSSGCKSKCVCVRERKCAANVCVQMRDTLIALDPECGVVLFSVFIFTSVPTGWTQSHLLKSFTSLAAVFNHSLHHLMRQRKDQQFIRYPEARLSHPPFAACSRYVLLLGDI